VLQDVSMLIADLFVGVLLKFNLKKLCCVQTKVEKVTEGM